MLVFISLLFQILFERVAFCKLLFDLVYVRVIIRVFAGVIRPDNLLVIKVALEFVECVKLVVEGCFINGIRRSTLGKAVCFQACFVIVVEPIKNFLLLVGNRADYSFKAAIIGTVGKFELPVLLIFGNLVLKIGKLFV